ncbi:MAG: hypothetical protein KGJ58_03670 [Patescibacteria group bacterium]|nr:hypothetical protein [Patescibacteria group bacterium]MDE1988458.1 hypothetical protein [Patescibacteria group bacterium]MDE2218522.1 hypothetical protein [Patescibacteria group bacterium]
MIYWLIQHIDTLIASMTTIVVAFFAYRSARMSEIANKAQFSPVIEPVEVMYHMSTDQSHSLSMKLRNVSKYPAAFAKSVEIVIDGKIIMLDNIDPDETRTITNNNMALNLTGQFYIKYEDILGNKFKTIVFRMGNGTPQITRGGGTALLAWRYKQV